MSKIFPQGGTQPVTAVLRRNEFVTTQADIDSELNTKQRIANAGDVIPIVFTDAGDTGGVWLNPPAVRWHFTNSPSGRFISYSICAVISDGEVPAISVDDVYQGSVKAGTIPASISTTYGKLPPDCESISDSFDTPNTLTPISFTVTETYVAAAGQSGIAFAAPVPEIPPEELYDEQGNFLPDVKKKTEKPWTGSRLYGQGVIEFTTRSKNVISLLTRVEGKLQKQGVGNGLDGELKSLIKLDTENTLTSKKFFSPIVTAKVFWSKEEEFAPSETGYGGEYTVRYKDPYVTATSLYPANQPNTTPYPFRIDILDKGGAWANVTGLLPGSYTGPRDSDVYVATGTSINVVLDDFQVHVTETSRYNYPTIDIPAYNGCGGTFEGLSVLGFSASKEIAKRNSVELLQDAETVFNQVYAYVRKGIRVERLLDGTRASSNLFPDLARYLLSLNVLVPAQLIDTAKLKIAAQFNNAEGLYFNGVISTDTNLRDYLGRIAPFFMLRFVQNNGLFALIPDLPIDPSTYKLASGPVTPVKTFDETNITDGSLTRQYVDLTERKPFCAVVLWRDQKATEPGRIRTVEVRYTGTAPDGPFEQYDLSEFCTTEAHAVKIGKYLLAKRRYTTHTISFTTNPLGGSPASSLLQPGDLIKVKEQRENSAGVTATEEYFYQIDSINETLTGEVSIEATHFPTLSTGASTVTYDVTTGSFAAAHGYC